MAAIPYDVAEAFLEGRVIDPETARAYSRTTAQHVSALLAKLPY